VTSETRQQEEAMSKKRAARSDPEEDEDSEDDHHVMNGIHNNNNGDGDGDSSDNEKMEDSEKEKKESIKVSSPTPSRKTKRRKRRRSLQASPLTPPPDLQKKAKRAKTATKGTTPKRASSSQTKPVPTNGDSEQLERKQPARFDSESPTIVPDPRRITYDVTSAIPPSIHEQEDDGSSENGASDELNIRPPTVGAVMNGTEQNTAVAEVDQTPVFHDATIYTNGTTRNDALSDSDQHSLSHDEMNKQAMPQEIDAAEKDGNDEALEGDSSNYKKSVSTGVSMFERIAIFFILGFLSLLLTMPQVIKLSQVVVPLDDSILPPAPKLPAAPLPVESEAVIEIEDEDEDDADDDEDDDDDGDDDGDDEDDEDEDEDDGNGEDDGKDDGEDDDDGDGDDDELGPIIPSEELQAWNKKFAENFEGLSRSKEAFSARNQVMTNHYKDLIERVEQIRGEVQTRHNLVESKLKELTLLEEFMAKETDKIDLDKTRGLAQQLLGKTIFTTSSIPLWNVPEDLDVDCDLGEAVNDDNYDEDADALIAEAENKPFLTEHLLKQKESALLLRSTITAEKFIGGTVAKDRIRNWVRSKIAIAIEDDQMSEIFGVIEGFINDLTELAVNKARKNDGEADSSDSLHLLLTEIIQNSLDVHRADLTGVFDHASLKNGAEIIYGGKRGTSKSLIDTLPIMNRILQSSNLRFYGFGPEAALTPTYPPNTLGQCWAFQQIPLKEQLKERELFEDQNKVPNDFKRGNFGTLTIRLPSPLWVESVIIEHPPIHLTDQANSAIRSFRVVGYEDKEAATKAWSLGSFEYSLHDNKNNNEYLQEFEVSNTVYGKEIPPLRSISLAVDSNYGNDYACLYRFRVHGMEEE